TLGSNLRWPGPYFLVACCNNMRRPIGITALAVYFFYEGISLLLFIFLDLRMGRISVRSPLLCAVMLGVVVPLLMCNGLGLTGWGLLRLQNWARVTAMLVIVVAMGARLPLFLLRTYHFNLSFLLHLTEFLVDIFVVWYLFRSATVEH